MKDDINRAINDAHIENIKYMSASGTALLKAPARIAKYVFKKLANKKSNKSTKDDMYET